MLCGVGKAASGSPVCANAMRKEKPRIQKGGELTEKGEREANEVETGNGENAQPTKGAQVGVLASITSRSLRGQVLMTLLPWDPYAISALSLSHVHSYQKLPYGLATVSRPTLFIKIYMNQSSTENMTLKLSGQSKHSYSKQAFSPP